MAIVQSRNQDMGPFEIVLPEPATAQQKILKEKIESVLGILKQKRGNTNYAVWLKTLHAIAQEGFDAPQPEPAAAMAKADDLTKTITRPDPEKPPQPQDQSRVGGFRVRTPDPEKDYDKDISWREIIFNVNQELKTVPPEQLNLKADIEGTLLTLQRIFPDTGEVLYPKVPTPPQRRFKGYQIKLLGLAQTGLQTPAEPDSARRALESLQAEILAQEGPQVKNKYMMSLGVAAAISAVVTGVIYLVLRNNAEFSHLLYAFRNFFLVWAGTMVGTWLSFGLRKPIISFKDLRGLEDDMVEPTIRLLFTGMIAIVIAFIFDSRMVNVSIGLLNSADLLAHGSTALLIGMLLGVSEQALPGALTRRASQFVTEVGGKP